ncbi:MAG: hypothetical protein RR396_02940 [Clostridiales bacterium]
MKAAAVDIGSNSVQLLAGQVADGQIITLAQALYTTRLGQSSRHHYLEKERIDDTIKALLAIKSALLGENIDNIRLVATSAVRDAVNKDQFLQAVWDCCGYKVDILSGQEEAALTYLGASSIGQEGSLVLDIGGGSTELVWPEQALSLNIGAVRAKNKQMSAQEIRSFLLSSLESYLPILQGRELLGVGGTVTTLAALKAGIKEYQRANVHGLILKKEDILYYRQLFQPLDDQQLCSFSPLLLHRGEIIKQGIWILESVLDLLAVKELKVSDAGILDGVLLSLEDCQQEKSF